MSSHRYLLLVLRKALSETTAFWSIHKNWTFVTPLVTALAATRYQQLGRRMTWDDLRVLAVFTAISYAIAWTGTFLINLVRAPKLLYNELLAGKARSSETAPMPLIALLYDNPGWERTKWFIRNHGSLSAFGVTVAPIDVGNYRAVFARIPELPPSGKRVLLDFNVTIDSLETQDRWRTRWRTANRGKLGPRWRNNFQGLSETCPSVSPL